MVNTISVAMVTVMVQILTANRKENAYVLKSIGVFGFFIRGTNGLY